ncbi:hypothetical protein UFOVP724_53 [uncultured Caudovirales phage]|uniref:Uncharacterized protein n=1 Tax=uncultured Caudovirales phage TaxID=2100421 RepID=A0A6J5NKY2_9CAUD|nr:hypothetical protein UFOVP724_53 [uncultured Caudovirales phage]
MNAIVYLCSIYGLSWIITYSVISYGARVWLYKRSENSRFFNYLFELTQCIVCTAWWVTLFTLITPFPYVVFKYQYTLMYLYLPFAMSAIVYWIGLITGDVHDDDE